MEILSNCFTILSKCSHNFVKFFSKFCQIFFKISSSFLKIGLIFFILQVFFKSIRYLWYHIRYQNIDMKKKGISTSLHCKLDTLGQEWVECTWTSFIRIDKIQVVFNIEHWKLDILQLRRGDIHNSTFVYGSRWSILLLQP